MATATGRSSVSSYMEKLPEQLIQLARSAGRAGGRVIADEVKANAQSSDVAEAVVVRSKVEGDLITVTVSIKRGWAYSLARWQEYGTSPHFISVDDEQRQGLGLLRINAKVKGAKGDGSLVIGGKFVGATVFHPGARPHPFLRPALDTKEAEALKAAQAYINARVAGGKISMPAEDDEA